MTEFQNKKNVFISNLRNNDCKVKVENNKIESRDLEYTIDKMIKNGIENILNIQNILNEDEIEIDVENLKEVRNLIRMINSSTYEKDREAFVKKLKTQIKRLFYNHRNKIAKNFEKVGE